MGQVAEEVARGLLVPQLQRDVGRINHRPVRQRQRSLCTTRQTFSGHRRPTRTDSVCNSQAHLLIPDGDFAQPNTHSHGKTPAEDTQQLKRFSATHHALLRHAPFCGQTCDQVNPHDWATCGDSAQPCVFLLDRCVMGTPSNRRAASQMTGSAKNSIEQFFTMSACCISPES